MTPEELVAAAEAKLKDADLNLAGCVDSMNEYKKRHGGVANTEVVALAQLQASMAQGYAAIAIAKASVAATTTGGSDG